MATWTAHWHPTDPETVTYWHSDMTEHVYLTVRPPKDGLFRWDIYTSRRRTAYGAAVSMAHGTSPTLAKAKAAALADWHKWAGKA